MSDPLALLPLALAAGGGRIGVAGDEHLLDAQQLVAAGLTLLQRSAPLVRALSGTPLGHPAADRRRRISPRSPPATDAARCS